MSPIVLSDELGEWYPLLKDKVDFKAISLQLGKEVLAHKVYPEATSIFRIFKELKPSDCRVILVGNEPYNDGQATGIAFGVESEPIPASLRTA